MPDSDFSQSRASMVKDQISKRGINDPTVLEAFGSIPRHLFVPKNKIDSAYSDGPLAIGYDQTISQPYIAALMTEILQLKPGLSALEIGTGSGYQAAILAYLGIKVYTIERIKNLGQKASDRFKALGYDIKVKISDGTLGWPEYAPYDRIIITAAAWSVPDALMDQLKAGGRIVAPLGGRMHQNLTILDKTSDNRIKEKKVCGCVFVPLIGEGV